MNERADQPTLEELLSQVVTLSAQLSPSPQQMRTPRRMPWRRTATKFLALVALVCLLLPGSSFFVTSSIASAHSSVAPPLTVSPTSFKSTDCSYRAGQGWSCQATIAVSSSFRGDFPWVTSSSLSGVTFTPSASDLSAGESTTVSISVPNLACSPQPAKPISFTFSVKGGGGVTVPWSCSGTFLTVTPASFAPIQGKAGNCGFKSGAGWGCSLQLGETRASQGNLTWTASSSLGGVTFIPSSGTLSPGQGVSVTISALPCQGGTLTFSGGAGTSAATASWSCATLTVTPTSLDQKSSQCTADSPGSGTYHCKVVLGEKSDSLYNVHWQTRSSPVGVTFSPASGAISSGEATPVTIGSLPCRNETLTFLGTATVGKGIVRLSPVTVSWTCTPSSPTLSVTPTSLDPTNTTNCALDATLSVTYKCTVSLGETSGSQGNANWSTGSSLSGVTFSPSSGTLQPGGSASVTIDLIPSQNGSFTFSGNEGETPVTVAWNCTPPALTVSPTSLNNGMCAGTQNASQCTVTLGESSTSQGNVNWAASSALSGVSFSPSTGTLTPGQTATVTISSILCQQGSFTFNGSGGASPAAVTWACANWGLLGYDTQNTRYNPLETGLSASNVSGLVVDWQNNLGVAGNSSPVVVNNMVYMNGGHGFLDALNITTGALVWQYYVFPAVNASPAVANGIVYVGGTDNWGGLYAFNATTGALLWHVGSSPTYTPTVANGVVYVSVDDGNLGSYSMDAYDAATGALLWSYANGGSPSFAPALDNGVVYSGAADGNLYALDATAGALKWSYYPHPGSPSINSAPTVGNGAVYIVDYIGLTALNETTGAVLWSTGPYTANSSTPAFANGTVYAVMGYYPTTVQALDPSTGVVKWSFNAGNYAGSYSAPAIANGAVYVGTESNVVYALDATNGTQLWSYTSGFHVNSSPSVVNGMLYVGSEDGNLYAFHLPGTAAKPRARPTAKPTAKHR